MIFIIILIIEVIFLYLLSRRTTSRIFYIVRRPTLFAILFLPGTFIHEISHFLTALFLLVPVGQIELVPQRVEGPRGEVNGIKMGSVPIGKTDPIRRTLIGVAPIIFGLSIILGSIFYVYTNGLYKIPLVIIILGIIAFEVGNTMFSSKRDLDGAIGVFVALTLIIVLLYLIGIRININFDLNIIKTANIFLLVPIGIDCLLLI